MEAFPIPSNINYYQVYFDIKSHKIPDNMPDTIIYS